MAWFSFRTFSLVLASLQIFLFGLSTIVCVVAICMYDKEEAHKGGHTKNESMHSTTAAPLVKETEHVITQEVDATAPTADISDLHQLPNTLEALITHFILSAVALTVTILLVLGIVKERPKIMRPYIFLNIFSMLFMVVFTVVGLILYIGEGKSAQDVAFATLRDVGYTCVAVFLFLPIYIVYNRLSNNHDQSEQLGLRNNADIQKPSYVQGDDV